MDLWQILVLAIVRHTLNTNWDRLEHIANHVNLIRRILGVHTTNFCEDDYEFAPNYRNSVLTFKLQP